MHSISVWASKHVWPARIFIILGHCINAALALFVGNSLGLFNWFIPAGLFYTAVALFLLVFFMYPDKRQKHRFRNFYHYQKSCDVLLVFCTFFFVLCIGNQPHKFFPAAAQPAAATAGFSANTPVADPGLKVKPTLKKHSKKILRQALLQKIRELRKAYKDTSTGGKIALIVLSVAVALGVLYLIAGLSCSLSCSGSDGAALIVAILGLSLVIFLLVRVIRRILKGPKPVKTPAST